MKMKLSLRLSISLFLYMLVPKISKDCASTVKRFTKDLVKINI